MQVLNEDWFFKRMYIIVSFVPVPQKVYCSHFQCSLSQTWVCMYESCDHLKKRQCSSFLWLAPHWIEVAPRNLKLPMIFQHLLPILRFHKMQGEQVAVAYKHDIVKNASFVIRNWRFYNCQPFFFLQWRLKLTHSHSHSHVPYQLSFRLGTYSHTVQIVN